MSRLCKIVEEEEVAYEELLSYLMGWEKEHAPFDVVSKLPHYEFRAQNGGHLQPLANLPALREFNLNEHSLEQMLQRMDFPVRFFRRLPPGLQYASVNWLVQNGAYDRDVLLRVIDSNVVRAMLSSKYEPFDHLVLVKLLEPYVGGGEIRWQYLDEDVLHLSVSFPHKAAEIRVGDVVETGVHVSNSEVGLRSVTIAAYVFRLKCKNGVIGRDGGAVYRFRHVGDNDRLRQMVESALADVWMEAESIVAKYKLALQKKVEHPSDVIQSVCKEKALTQDEYKAVLNSFFEEPGDSYFEISQGFSRAAQKLPAERSYELQRIASEVL